MAGAAVFSGRPDPTWPISDELGARLQSLWTRLPIAEAEAVAPGLGYRGCFLISPERRSWLAYGRSVRDETESRRDQDRNFESSLIASAPPGVLPPWVPAPATIKPEVEKCEAEFYNCEDSTDAAPHHCDLDKGHLSKLHHCPCGLRSNC